MEIVKNELEKLVNENIDFLVENILDNFKDYEFAEYLPRNKELVKNILLRIVPLINELIKKSFDRINIEDIQNNDVLDFIKNEVLNHYTRGIALENFLNFLYIIYESLDALFYEKYKNNLDYCNSLSKFLRNCFFSIVKEIIKYWNELKYPQLNKAILKENLSLISLKKTQELRETLLNSILTFLGGIFFIVDKELNVVFISGEFSEKFGLSADKIKNLYDFHEKFHRCKSNFCPIIDGIKRDVGHEFVEAFTLADGRESIFKVRMLKDIVVDGKIWKIIVMDDLSSNLERLDSILFSEIANAAELSIVLTDISGHIEYVNRFFEKTTGYTASESIGQNPKILKSGAHDEHFYKELWDNILSGKIWKGKFKNKRKDGSFYYEKAVIVPIKDVSGNILKFVAMKEDITKQVELEMQVYISQRYEYLNRLVGRFAHDLNNVLTYLYALNDEIESSIDDNKIKELIVGNKNALMKIADMIKSLSSFSRRDHLEMEKTTVKDIYEDLMKINKRLIPTNIAILVDFSDASYVNVDKMLMQQVLYNIIVNAKDAVLKKFGSAEGGRIGIVSEKIAIDSSYKVKISEFETLTVKVGSYISIRVSDNGVGIPKEHIYNIFEPFFTNNSNNQKVGLGLSAAYGIVKQHNGYIFVDSTEGIGTNVTIFLPEYKEIIKDDKVEFKEENTKIYKLPPLTVMIVDDEPEILNYIEKVVSVAGGKVNKFDNYKSAEEFLRSANELDFIIVDYILKDGNGLRLFEKARDKFLKLKTIVISGQADSNLKQHPEFNKGFLFLRKPFKGSTLINLMKFFLESYKI